MSLLTCFDENSSVYEIGVDEVGRGPMFGRVYTASVVLPKDEDAFDHSRMKDSKRFHSKRKIEEVADYIRANAIAYSVSYEEAGVVDSINILQATQQSMHTSIKETIKQLPNGSPVQLLIDGNYFKPYSTMNKVRKMFDVVPHVCIEGGDNKYTSIAAASILAKVARDAYIAEMCLQYPELDEKYGIASNKGYGSKRHLDGIQTHGITIWHRRSFGICKKFTPS
jgi:ribonuclease HII